jgi:uncharacterized protein YndB with AHSA1/START domain
MTTMDAHDAAEAEDVAITHVFDAPIEDVFRAWTDPHELSAWYGPASMRTPRERIRIDLQVGGRYELTMVSLDGEREFAIGYEIVELSPPELLVLRSDPMPGSVEGSAPTVRVALEDLGGRTRMTLTDGPLTFGRAQAEAGYHGAIEKLAAHLAPVAGGDHQSPTRM